jgi:hypothetical protein
LAHHSYSCQNGADHISIPKLTHEIIAAAILGFEEQKRQIDTQIAEVKAIQTGASTATAVGTEIIPARTSQAERRR